MLYTFLKAIGWQKYPGENQVSFQLIIQLMESLHLRHLQLEIFGRLTTEWKNNVNSQREKLSVD